MHFIGKSARIAYGSSSACRLIEDSIKRLHRGGSRMSEIALNRPTAYAVTDQLFPIKCIPARSMYLWDGHEVNT